MQSDEEGVLVTPVDPSWLTEQIIVFLTADQMCILFFLSFFQKKSFVQGMSQLLRL